MKEVWKNINQHYLISNLGNVKSLKCKNGKAYGEKYSHLLKPIKKKHGYFEVYVGKFRLVHRLVAEAFIEKIEGKEYIDHIDNNKNNNCVDNLRWVSMEENNRYRYEDGRANQYTLYKQKNKPI